MIVTKVCSICGEKYEARCGRQMMCDRCRAYADEHMPQRRVKLDKDEYYIRLRAEVRSAHNDTIVGEGYAERQIQDSLRLAGKIDTNL